MRRNSGGVGPDMFNGVGSALLGCAVVIMVIAFCSGVFVKGCADKYGTPKVELKK